MNRHQRRAMKAKGLIMPDQANLDTKEQDIRNRYIQECAKAGELQYKIGQLEYELSLANSTLTKINDEFRAHQEAKAKEVSSVEASSQIAVSPA